MDRSVHWNRVYASRTDDDLSWFESEPSTSLRLMEESGLTLDTCVIDIGGGNSRLVDALILRGLTCLAVLDISSEALQRARVRLGGAASIPAWIDADVAGDWSVRPMDIWHDRAVFHFLTSGDDRARYVDHLRRTLKVGGTAIIATFAPDGPERCSGLPVVRYSPETLAAELGPEFRLLRSTAYVHTTPRGTAQSFQYSRFGRVSASREGR